MASRKGCYNYTSSTSHHSPRESYGEFHHLYNYVDLPFLLLSKRGLWLKTTPKLSYIVLHTKSTLKLITRDW